MDQERELVIGTPVDVGCISGMVKNIVSLAEERRGGYVCVANVHMVTLARGNPLLLNVMRNASYVTADGMPLVWAQHFHGHINAERVAGPDLMERLCSAAVEERFSVYLYGATDSVLEKLGVALAARFPGLLVVGEEVPPMLPEAPSLDMQVANRINQSGASIVFVGLGCPKQEYWMATHAPHIKAVLIGVGAAFDFLAGSKRRAPKWMQSKGLEWLFRLVSEPRRLWRRYAVTNGLFLLYLLVDMKRRKVIRR